MSLLLATQITAISTALLAAFAIATAWYARRAYIAQRKQLILLQEQESDQQALIGQQAELLKVQSGQLDLQRQQLEDQRKINEKQAGVAELQAQELRESLDERKREATERRQAQAAQVFVWLKQDSLIAEPSLAPYLRNSSRQPIYDLAVAWGGSAAASLPHLLPGDEYEIHGAGSAVANGAVPVQLKFRDANSVRWLTTSQGQLTEMPAD
jgi:hypothetical protein